MFCHQTDGLITGWAYLKVGGLLTGILRYGKTLFITTV